MVLSEGINWLLTGHPDGNYPSHHYSSHQDPSYRPSSVIGGLTDSLRDMTSGGGSPEDEYYASERVHAYLKQMQHEMRSMCNAPMDVVFHHYHGGSFTRPNGFIYDSSYNNSRNSTRRGRCVAVITMGEDPRYRYGHYTPFHQSSQPSSYLSEHAIECIMMNSVEGIILTNYRSWMFVHIDDLEPHGPYNNKMLHRFQQLRNFGDPRYSPMVRVAHSSNMWGYNDSTRRQLMHLVQSAHRHRREKRHTHLFSAGRAMSAMQMMT